MGEIGGMGMRMTSGCGGRGRGVKRILFFLPAGDGELQLGVDKG